MESICEDENAHYAIYGHYEMCAYIEVYAANPTQLLISFGG
jgi:hypothetical protein